ncbi:uncharacterized protein TNCV_4104851 [Trichonephila clavipes]|nr:uncharacterized protein TNCV_4104851 [Trichonephila clavipes]
MEAFPMPDIRAETVADNILKGRISRFGTPLVITTDQGTHKQKPFIFKDCSHVFVRTDSVRRSLQPPYHGPYKVINRSDKFFTLFIKGKNVNVSIDRLKPCFSDNSSESDIESNIGEDTPAEKKE